MGLESSSNRHIKLFEINCILIILKVYDVVFGVLVFIYFFHFLQADKFITVNFNIALNI